MSILSYWRCLIIIPILLAQMWSNAAVSVRTIQFMAPLLPDPRRGGWTFPLPDQTITLFDPVTSTTSTGPVTPWILRDLGFEIFPFPPTAAQGDQWQAFINATPLIFIGTFVLLWLLWSRKGLRVVEYIGLLSLLVLINIGAHLFTTLPSSLGLTDACLDPTHVNAGPWEGTTIGFSACGDQMFSSHLMHTIVAKIMIARLLWWDIAQTPLYTSPDKGDVMRAWNRTGTFIWYVAVELFMDSWILALVLSMIYNRFHYTADIWISAALSLGFATHVPFLRWVVVVLYPLARGSNEWPTVGMGGILP